MAADTRPVHPATPATPATIGRHVAEVASVAGVEGAIETRSAPELGPLLSSDKRWQFSPRMAALMEKNDD